MSPSPKSQVFVRVRILMIFFVFLGFILFTQRPLFTRRVHMHLTPEGGPNEGRVRSLAIGRRHNKVGVSLQEMRGTTQVMLGVSLRARWDTTLVIIITVKTYVGVLQSPVKGALYRIQILCRRYTFWSYPAGLTIADTPGKQKLKYRRVYSHHFQTTIAESIHTTPNSIQCPCKSSEPREEHENRTMKKNHKPRRAV